MQITKQKIEYSFEFICRGFGENPEGKYEMRLNGPKLVLKGPYDISGQILILPIQGKGNSTFVLDNPELLVKWTGKTHAKHNKVHLYTDDLRLTFKITRWVILAVKMNLLVLERKYNLFVFTFNYKKIECKHISATCSMETKHWAKQRTDFWMKTGRVSSTKSKNHCSTALV